MKLKLSFSTCPNDTFMFDALVNGRINTHGFDFEIHLADIDELNKLAFEGVSDITKISFNALSKVTDSYQLLNAGSALGSGVGPLVISKKQINAADIQNARVAIPGLDTTANMLFSIAYPNAKNKKVHLFSDIEEAILSNEVDAGVIIHENRFTYEKKGLKKIADLGEYWETLTKLPIPLGGIAVRKSLSDSVKSAIDSMLRQSVEHAFNNPKDSYPYVRKYAQSMEEEVMYKHIQLYVNKYSINLGETGHKAIMELYNRSYLLNITPKVSDEVFLSI